MTWLRVLRELWGFRVLVLERFMFLVLQGCRGSTDDCGVQSPRLWGLGTSFRVQGLRLWGLGLKGF